METFNDDPKPGRLVLPLVLIGMIATTYTFINRVSTSNDLEIIPNEQANQETIIEEEVVEDTTTTTTTTLPSEVVSYLEEISSEKIQSIDLASTVLQANDDWDNENVSYQEAKDNFAPAPPGHSLTEDNTKWAWGKPQQVVDPEVALEQAINSIKQPKIQETSTINLLSCIGFKKNKNSDLNIFNCSNKDLNNNVIENLNRRNKLKVYNF